MGEQDQRVGEQNQRVEEQDQRVEEQGKHCIYIYIYINCRG